MVSGDKVRSFNPQPNLLKFHFHEANAKYEPLHTSAEICTENSIIAEGGLEINLLPMYLFYPTAVHTKYSLKIHW